MSPNNCAKFQINENMSDNSEKILILILNICIDAFIYLWKMDPTKCNTDGEETWLYEKLLRRHLDNVSDLSWSADGLFLVSASVDNSALVWDIKKVYLFVSIWILVIMFSLYYFDFTSVNNLSVFFDRVSFFILGQTMLDSFKELTMTHLVNLLLQFQATGESVI